MVAPKLRCARLACARKGGYVRPRNRSTPMPYVNIKITREGGTTAKQKAELIHSVTDLLVKVLNKNPSTTVVVIDEVEMDNWGMGGLPFDEFRRKNAAR